MQSDQKPICVILGGGGHARVIIDSLQASDTVIVYAVVDPDRSLWGRDLLGVPVVGNDRELPSLIGQGVNSFVVGVGSTGDMHTRRRLFDLGLLHNLLPVTVVHPSASCSRWAKIGQGSQLLPHCVVNAGSILGSNVIVNSGAIVEHDCIVGDHVHIATGAHLASTVQIGGDAHIGIGASVKQCVHIGAGAIVGAGAVVVKDVEPHTLVVGVPARVLRRLEDQ